MNRAAKRFAGRGAKLYLGPLWCHFQTTKTENRPKHWEYLQSKALMPYTCPILICLFLKFGPPSWFRAQGMLPPSLSGPDYKCLYVVTFFLVNFVFFKAVNWHLVYAAILTLVFYFRWISKMQANYCLEILKRQMQEIKERNGCFNLTFYILYRIISKKITNT